MHCGFQILSYHISLLTKLHFYIFVSAVVLKDEGLNRFFLGKPQI
jgi:hypothetical protein